MSGVDETERSEDDERLEDSEREAWPEASADPGAPEPDEEVSVSERAVSEMLVLPGRPAQRIAVMFSLSVYWSISTAPTV